MHVDYHSLQRSLEGPRNDSMAGDIDRKIDNILNNNYIINRGILLGNLVRLILEN